MSASTAFTKVGIIAKFSEGGWVFEKWVESRISHAIGWSLDTLLSSSWMSRHLQKTTITTYIGKYFISLHPTLTPLVCPHSPSPRPTLWWLRRRTRISSPFPSSSSPPPSPPPLYWPIRRTVSLPPPHPKRKTRLGRGRRWKKIFYRVLFQSNPPICAWRNRHHVNIIVSLSSFSFT